MEKVRRGTRREAGLGRVLVAGPGSEYSPQRPHLYAVEQIQTVMLLSTQELSHFKASYY